MKGLLKKLRWKWHRDIMELGIEPLCRELREVKSLVAENRYNLEQQTNIPAPIDTFPAELEKVFSLLEDWESQKLLLARAYISRTWPNKNLVPLFQLLMESERRGNPKDLISY